MLADVLQGGGFAKACHVGIVSRALFSTPGVVGVCDLLNLLIRQFTPGAIHQHAQRTGIHQQHLPASVAQPFAGIFITRQKPQTSRNLRGVKQLPRHCDHAIHDVSLNHVCADLPSPEWLELIEPLASTTPAVPLGARWW